MADIFSRPGSDFQGSFASDAAKIVFGGMGQNLSGVGMLTQSVNFAYSQNITRIYEVGTNFTYLIAGRTQGQATIQRIIGPKAVAVGFYRKYGNVCEAAENTINFEVASGCQSANGAETSRFQLRNCVINNIQASVQSQDMMVNEAVTLVFIALDLK